MDSLVGLMANPARLSVKIVAFQLWSATERGSTPRRGECTSGSTYVSSITFWRTRAWCSFFLHPAPHFLSRET
jgi:hypothetical protein